MAFCQLSRHISNPQRFAGASESNKNIVTIKKNKQKNILFREKNMNRIQSPTQVAQLTDHDLQLQDKRISLKTHTHGGYIPLHTHITAAMQLIEDADALLSKWRMCDLTPDNI